jgi:hypothetical protein
MVSIENYNPYLSYVNLNYEGSLPNGNYYYLDINPGNLIQIRKIRHLAAEVVNQGKILLLDNTKEGFTFNIPFIYEELVLGKNIPEDKIFLLSGAKDIDIVISNVAKKYDRKPIQSKWYLFWPYTIVNQTVHERLHFLYSSFLDQQFEYRKNNFKKVYINLNRRWRMHRTAMVTHLTAKNLLDHGYVSLTKADDGINWHNYYDYILEEHKNYMPSYKILEEYRLTMYRSGPLIVDKSELVEDQAHIKDSIESFMWESVINLVSETNFYTSMKTLKHDGTILNEPTKFISEKTCKPILYHQPFIMISVPYFLDMLRELGFKTFHPYIDESYDTELNDAKRMMMIVKQVERFSKYSRSELQEFLDLTKDICRHNFYKLFEITGCDIDLVTTPR